MSLLPPVFPPQAAFTPFRQTLLRALQSLRQARPQTRVFVLYDPVLADPLDWLPDERRAVTLLRHAAGPGVAPPRLIELDCRKTAPYLFETDTALDDPWFEASVTQAYRYAQAGALTLAGDPGRAVCGWIVTAASGHQVAQRFATASRDWAAPVDDRYRWHDPRALAHLWDGLSMAQRGAFLGQEMVWLALDGQGRLRAFQGETDKSPASRPGALTLAPEQRQRARQAGLVNRLLATCQKRGASLSEDSAERLHRRLSHPLAASLDGPDRAAFALATVALADSFGSDPRWQDVVRDLPRRGMLEDALRHLPRQAWADHRAATMGQWESVA
ncbi:hypothetical protein L7Q78_27125 [Achromobacter xylosoxidans]|nr:hypothetical protein [Achromobacter xylosoxidans]